MYALEFESSINGNTLEIPLHLLRRMAGQRQVKVIVLMPEKKQPSNTTDPRTLPARLLAIGQRCAALPLLDQGTPDEILGYDDDGMPTR